ncbi:MAG: hypothetical protein LBU50_04000 [Cellulomonas sp.]|jgi:hypothetical protein|nr:hypothetical protein [Cellulomonas sp.]
MAVRGTSVVLARELAVQYELGRWPAARLFVQEVQATGQLWAWRVGDPDPWADELLDDHDMCMDRSPKGLVCILPLTFHDGPHMASDSARVVEVW